MDMIDRAELKVNVGLSVAVKLDAGHLESFVQRIEHLENEKTAIATDIKEVYAEAKSMGYDVKAMRIIVKERKQDQADVIEQQTIVEVYRNALAELADTPLGISALKKVS